MLPSTQTSYLAQVSRLRRMARDVLENYRFKSPRLTFIQHGENATFKVSEKGRHYLLRMHRDGYHTKPAILEELGWLKHINEHSDISVQQPVPSNNGNLVEHQSGCLMPARYCSLLKWQDGRKNLNRLGPKPLFKIGALLAKLHCAAIGVKIKHRKYWTVDGLVGPDALMGSIIDIKERVSAQDFFIIERCRTLIHTKLNHYQKSFPEKMSMIHADLHFGNILWNQGRILPIDFDDCGFGFHLSDLAVVIHSLDWISDHNDSISSKRQISALLDGYASLAQLSTYDIEALPYFILARQMSLAAWLNARADHPRLVDRFVQSIQGDVKLWKRVVDYGADPI